MVGLMLHEPKHEVTKSDQNQLAQKESNSNTKLS